MTIYEVVKGVGGGSKALERIPTAIVRATSRRASRCIPDEQDLETFNTIAKDCTCRSASPTSRSAYQHGADAAGLADQDTSVALTIIDKLAALE